MNYNGYLYDMGIEHHDDCISVISKNLDTSLSMLDLGCGTLHKFINLNKKIGVLYGVDNNTSMLKRALLNLNSHKVDNFFLVEANNFYLPFKQKKFDIITALLTNYSLIEVNRVLNDHGIFFLEVLGTEDKKELKKLFGQDELGWRGLLMNQSQDNYQKSFETFLSCFFKNVEIYEFKKTIKMSYRSFLNIVIQTPTIRGFCMQKDRSSLQKVIKLCDSDERLTVVDHRILFKCKKY